MFSLNCNKIVTTWCALRNADLKINDGTNTRPSLLLIGSRGTVMGRVSPHYISPCTLPIDDLFHHRRHFVNAHTDLVLAVPLADGHRFWWVHCNGKWNTDFVCSCISSPYWCTCRKIQQAFTIISCLMFLRWYLSSTCICIVKIQVFSIWNRETVWGLQPFTSQERPK